jgi:hypothetical protein
MQSLESHIVNSNPCIRGQIDSAGGQATYVLIPLMALNGRTDVFIASGTDKNPLQPAFHWFGDVMRLFAPTFRD